MVLPIIVGIGATVIALGAKASISAYRKYLHLTPQMIASLNNITLHSSSQINRDILNGKRHKDAAQHMFLLQNYPKSGFDDEMTEREALLILGIEGDDILRFDRKMLKDRYRKLVVVNHPDKHGSQYISQKINQAKNVLEKSYLLKDK
ncbi:mitochondrial DnaJ homolog 2 [[Candida] railenensis]|uniref:Mitochondrial DnaJ homolog 2 n=1 Tax=[Candida] railenensis TaxID=45579 RepID=A0A9P0W147_9ASCO|nr:mitochondrial DnaJ homolog 2 [[Candida] railenensis]